jgi:hypothetical protein
MRIHKIISSFENENWTPITLAIAEKDEQKIKNYLDHYLENNMYDILNDKDNFRYNTISSLLEYGYYDYATKLLKESSEELMLQKSNEFSIIYRLNFDIENNQNYDIKVSLLNLIAKKDPCIETSLLEYLENNLKPKDFSMFVINNLTITSFIERFSGNDEIKSKQIRDQLKELNNIKDAIDKIDNDEIRYTLNIILKNVLDFTKNRYNDNTFEIRGIN